jgi:hypothetical protein
LVEHAGCPREGETVFPKRVLEFREPSPGEIYVCLRIESDDITSKEFAALSHCWGSHQRCVTTKGTLENHRRGIPWSQIPQTFQDSIRFCLAIGIQYLWIDAMCIVQDDPVDWQIESARMADIYQNAHVTLAATHSSSDSGGCFPEHHGLVAERTLSLPDDFPSLWRGLKFREKARHWALPLPRSSSRSYPLLTRGWAFQERILAPRVLHFCGDEMIWECNSVCMCECGGLPVYDSSRDLFSDIAESEVLAQEAHGLTQYPTVDVRERMAELVLGVRIPSNGSSMGPESDDADVPPPPFDAEDLTEREYQPSSVALGWLPTYGGQAYNHQ